MTEPVYLCLIHHEHLFKYPVGRSARRPTESTSDVIRSTLLVLNILHWSVILNKSKIIFALRIIFVILLLFLKNIALD